MSAERARVGFLRCCLCLFTYERRLESIHPECRAERERDGIAAVRRWLRRCFGSAGVAEKEHAVTDEQLCVTQTRRRQDHIEANTGSASVVDQDRIARNLIPRRWLSRVCSRRSLHSGHWVACASADAGVRPAASSSAPSS
jgi:hypothetical protein